jgi:TRAP-type mannitol/chloroaromatic compound transport system permease large subunit
MEIFLIHNMAPIMFGSLVVFLLLGYPAAFSLGAVGLIFALIGIEFGLFVPDFLQALPERVYGVMSNDTLLAIPFFTFMGLVLERSGMAEDLLDTIGQLFGTVRGGLAYAVVFVGALLAATTGVVAASVISMGLISLPIMLRYGYDRRVATGVIAASGTVNGGAKTGQRGGAKAGQRREGAPTYKGARSGPFVCRRRKLFGS